ncbi:HNH endonuclease signature motif containing protein [Aspergillus puulaauensis]|uniref:HNH nuclease domain-containing protein n=1 Tax=Aspergillus puulaauensis TaxID=1220207 RepID=A0A7R7XNM8_9EURO|nr:uncharacterized protein APUU_40911S [Aspergillus puulaauensis]BCS24467.1 hypothetical protein APUU_40911S [Aspergillus puulaauensis]
MNASVLSNMSSNISDGNDDDLVQQATDRISEYVPTTDSNWPLQSNLMSTLGAFIEFLPQSGKVLIAKDVVQARTDKDLYAVYNNLVTGLLCLMKASRGLSVAVSPHPKRRANAELVSPQSRTDAFRNNCLQRDNHHCVVSNALDITSHIDNNQHEDTARLEAAHIIPFSYGSWNSRVESDNTVADTWEMLYRCFPSLRRVGFSVDSMNDISNGITLDRSIHYEFGSFNVAFIQTDSPNQYTVKSYPGCPSNVSKLVPKHPIQFRDADRTEDLPPPKPELLDCHYRLAEILHASGMGPCLERMLHDLDDMKEASGYMSESGSTDFSTFLRIRLWEAGIYAHG